MTHTSPRVLRETEQSFVTPIQWRVATPPKAKVVSSPVRVKEVQPEQREQPAPERNPDAQAEQERAEQERAEHERIVRETYHRGFSEGKAVGREQSAVELKPVLDRLGRSLANLAALRSRFRTEAESDLVKLAIAIARRVLHRELTLDPESIEGLIRVALEKLQSRELSRVRVHPDQEAAIRGSLERFANSQKVDVIADPSMQCGDVVFETAQGNLDASIESQLREIERGFADRLHR